MEKDGFLELMRNLDEDEAIHLFNYICRHYAYEPDSVDFINLVLERLSLIRQERNNRS